MTRTPSPHASSRSPLLTVKLTLRAVGDLRELLARDGGLLVADEALFGDEELLLVVVEFFKSPRIFNQKLLLLNTLLDERPHVREYSSGAAKEIYLY